MKSKNDYKFFHGKIPELKRLKEVFSKLKHRDIELWPSIIENSYIYYYQKNMGSFLFKILRILKFLFFIEKFRAEGKGKNKLTFSILIDRKDHNALFQNTISSFDKKDIIVFNAFQSGVRNFRSVAKRFWFSFPNLIKIFKIYKYLSKNKVDEIIKGKTDFFYFVLLTYSMFKKIDYWEEIYAKYEPKGYVSYSGYRNNDETIFAQICNKNGKPTFAMQNYTIFDFSTFNSEAITYENVIPNYFMVWGESSSDVLKKFIDKERIIIAGNPSYTKIKRTNKKFNPKTCVIFFDYPQYTKSNYDIIDIMSKFAEEHPEIKFYIKPHPENKEKDYTKKLEGKKLIWLDKYADKEEWMKKAGFIIVHNTTIALEALRHQIPVFRYKDDTFFDMSIPEYNFKNLEEVNNLFLKVKSKKDYTSEYYKSYYENFFQPKDISIPENYKTSILRKIAK